MGGAITPDGRTDVLDTTRFQQTTLRNTAGILKSFPAKYQLFRDFDECLLRKYRYTFS